MIPKWGEVWLWGYREQGRTEAEQHGFLDGIPSGSRSLLCAAFLVHRNPEAGCSPWNADPALLALVLLGDCPSHFSPFLGAGNGTEGLARGRQALLH